MLAGPLGAPDNRLMSKSPIVDGWHFSARRCESPNANERPEHCTPELIVVHNISLPPGKFGTGDIEALFCNRLDCSADPFYEELIGLEVSSHFLIDRDGAVTQFVSTDRRAWHAGRSTYAGRTECNDFSIGIELEGTDTLPYSEAQYRALAELIADLRKLLRKGEDAAEDTIVRPTEAELGHIERRRRRLHGDDLLVLLRRHVVELKDLDVRLRGKARVAIAGHDVTA